LEAEARWVNDGNDREWHASVGQIGAARASIVGQLNLEEVLVDNVTTVASRLSAFHHKSIFWRELHSNTLAFLFTVDSVPDLRQIENQLSLETTFSESGAGLIVFDQLFDVGVSVSATKAPMPPNSASLLNEEFDAFDVERALRVINVDHSLGTFLGRVDVLFEVGPHGGDTLVNAAPSLDDRLLVLSLVLLELKWGLADGKHLLVLHVLAAVSRNEDGLSVVLYLGLWALSHISVLEVNGAGDFHWQHELEADGVAARLQHAALDRENGLLVVRKSVGVLNAL